MTKEEMFGWIVDNNAEILRSHCMTWRRPDGSTFTTNFVLNSGGTRWPAAETLQEAIEFAARFGEN